METPYTPEEAAAIRKRWYELLRVEDDNIKITGSFCDDKGHCALGVLWLAAGGTFSLVETGEADYKMFEATGLEDRGYDPETEPVWDLADHVLDPTGTLETEEASFKDEVWLRNDGGGRAMGRGKFERDFWTFKRIAEWAEEKFG